MAITSNDLFLLLLPSSSFSFSVLFLATVTLYHWPAGVVSFLDFFHQANFKRVGHYGIYIYSGLDFGV